MLHYLHLQVTVDDWPARMTTNHLAAMQNVGRWCHEGLGKLRPWARQCPLQSGPAIRIFWDFVKYSLSLTPLIHKFAGSMKPSCQLMWWSQNHESYRPCPMTYQKWMEFEAYPTGGLWHWHPNPGLRRFYGGWINVLLKLPIFDWRWFVRLP